MNEGRVFYKHLLKPEHDGSFCVKSNKFWKRPLAQIFHFVNILSLERQT